MSKPTTITHNWQLIYTDVQNTLDSLRQAEHLNNSLPEPLPEVTAQIRQQVQALRSVVRRTPTIKQIDDKLAELKRAIPPKPQSN